MFLLYSGFIISVNSAKPPAADFCREIQDKLREIKKYRKKIHSYFQSTTYHHYAS